MAQGSGPVEKGGVEILEEGLNLLRQAPAELLFPHYLGTLPFALGFLFFWDEMSVRTGANLAAASLGLALLFAWKCFGQARFARRLTARLEGEAPQPLAFREALRLAAAQTLAGAAGWVLLPLAAAALLPLPWYLSLLHTLPGCGAAGAAAAAIREAGAHAGFAPRQNRRLLLMLVLAGPFLFLNVAAAGYLLPELARRVLGLESIFGLSDIPLASTTFAAAAVVGGYYLFLDPAVKAAYAVRLFYSRSQRTGADLLAELNRLRRPAAGVLLAALCLLPAPGEAGDIPAADLERTIGEVLARPEFDWRAPESKPLAEERPGLFGEWLSWLGEGLAPAWNAVRRAAAWLLMKLFRERRAGDAGPAGTPADWRILLALLSAALLGAAALLLLRGRRRQAPAAAALAPVVAAAPDLTDDNVRADELASAGWAALAREMADRGELRVALRALFLGALAALAARGWVTIHPAASNREYERELGRRAHDRGGLIEAFGECRAVFERVWYGMHPVDREGYEGFRALQERIVGLADRP
jgi:hypothetical protein